MGVAAFVGIYIIAAPFFILVYVGYWKLFEKAGRHGWEALIPLYSSYVMLKLSGRPAWWLIWLLIPVVSEILTIGICIEFFKSFGKFKRRQQLGGIVLAFFYLPKWGFDKETQYLGPSASALFKQEYPVAAKHSSTRRWIEIAAIWLLIILLFRSLFFETYTVPTPSMERTLLTGDFFVVNKLNYGARLPITPVAFPFIGNTFSPTTIKTYWDGLNLGYHRVPGFSQIKRGDVIVFNYPMEADSPYFRPVDKRESYIKRCVGLPGDTLSVINAVVSINSKLSPNPPESQIDYTLAGDSSAVNPLVLQKLNISVYDGTDAFTMTEQSARALKRYAKIKSVKPNIASKRMPDPSVFPGDIRYPRAHPFGWNADNYGPVIIPKKGWTVTLDSLSLPFYRRAITVYEGNKLQQVGNDILINGVKTNTYTFKMNYYWVMGDNRHDSLDSRYWGFVPEDHIVGKVWFTWMSWDENAPLFSKIRWERIFKVID